MTFWDHLSELRGTLMRSLLAIAITSSLGLCFKDYLFDMIILGPMSGDFFIYRWFPGRPGLELVNLEVSGQFMVHLKMSILMGVVLAFPYIIWEIWKFVAPALYKQERKGVGKAFCVSSLLFYMGALMGYFVLMPVCLAFFQNYQVSESVLNTFSLQSYISLFTSMVLLLGLVFEFPLLIWILSKMGIVTKSMLKKGRKFALVGIMIVSAFITPADLGSMVIVALPLYALYELSIAVCPKPAVEEENTEEND